MARTHRNPLNHGVAMGIIVVSSVVVLGVSGHLRGAIASRHYDVVSAQVPIRSSPLDLAIISDDHAVSSPGCDAISIVDTVTSKSLINGAHRVSPGKLSATSDASTILALCTNNCRPSWIYVLNVNHISGNHSTYLIEDSRRSNGWLMGGTLVITRDDSDLLIPTSRGIEKYNLETLLDTAVGSVTGEWIGAQPSTIVQSRATNEIFVVGAKDYDERNGSYSNRTQVYSIDARTMKELRAPIPIEPPHSNPDLRLRRTFAALSPDERYLVVNVGEKPALNIVDLRYGVSVLVPIIGLEESLGVKFNYSSTNHGILAVHGRTSIALYEWRGIRPPLLLTSEKVPGPNFKLGSSWNTFGAIAWSGRGDAVIASIVSGLREWRIFDVSNESGMWSMLQRNDFDGCTYDQNNDAAWSAFPYDILTLNDRIPPPSPTPSPTPAPTSSSSATPSPSPTTTPSPTTSAAPSPIPSATPSPTPTPPPTPIFLPLLLREQCMPEQQRVDVILVLDASTSMREVSAAGRPKIDAAREAARTFLGLLKLRTGDQAGLVSFNRVATRIAVLGADRAALEEALDGIVLAEQTCIACGILAGAEELAGPRRRADNLPVLILLTDGRSNPGPVSEAVDRADEAKRAGITLFTIGLGEDVETEALRAIASRPDQAYLAPDAEDLVDIYGRIAVALPCPASAFWGGR